MYSVAGGNIIDTHTLEKISNAGILLNINILNPPCLSYMAGDNKHGGKAQLVCTKSACIDTELQTRHRSSSLIRNLSWLVTGQKVVQPLVGRPVQVALGLNTRKLLAAAADRFAGSVDAERVL